MKKKKKYLPLVILLAVLAVLCVLYAVVCNVNQKNEKAAEEEAAGDSDMIKIADYDLNDVKHIEFTSDSITTSLTVGSDNVWHYDEDENFPVDQDKLDELSEAVASISADRTVDEGEPSDYGLDEPSLTLTVRYSGDVTCVYKIGDVNSFNSKTYFMADDKIYMISDSISTKFDCTINDLIKVSDSFPDDIDDEYVNRITVKNADGETCEISDSDGVSALVTLMKQKITYKSWKEYGVLSDKKSDEYGITDESAQIVIDYKRTETVANEDGTESETKVDTKYTVNFGKASDEGYFYSTPNSDMVYKMIKDDYDLLMEYATYKPEEQETAES